MEESTTPEAQEQIENMPALEEMARAGILFGRKRSVTHPKMRKYIFGARNGFEIIDLQKTQSQLEKAKAFLSEAVSTGKPILYVAIRPEMHDVIKEAATKFGYPYVAQRWPGGAITNFETISKRINYYTSLKADKAAGKFEKYTKKEQVSLEKKIERLDRLFGGLEPLDRLPAALIVIGAKTHKTAIHEANLKNIPVIVLANTDTNPDKVDYLIPSNDTSRSGATYILAQLAKAIEEGKKKMSAPKVEVPKKAPQE